MTAQELKAGDSFQYRQSQRWSNNFTAKKIIDWPELNNIFIETTSGRKVIIDRSKLVRIN
jgi:hypothetical protein